jgi:hypothetical protein
MRLTAAFLAIFIIFMAPAAYCQEDGSQERRLKIIEPREIEPLDPAFEMIMQKLDGDLRHVLSAPVRLTPKGTALAGLTAFGTLFLLNEDENYKDAFTDSKGDRSDRVYDRLGVLGRHVPEATASIYLLGYFLDDTDLKSRALGGLEAVAITALLTAGSGYIIGHKGPNDIDSSDEFEPFSRYHSMPDMSSSLVFSAASAFAYDRPWHQSLIIYGIAAGTAASRIYHEEAWSSDVFLGSVLGTAIGRTVAARSRGDREKSFSVLPVLEYHAEPAIGLKLEFKL